MEKFKSKEFSANLNKRIREIKDKDLNLMIHEELIDEIKKLRNGLEQSAV